MEAILGESWSCRSARTGFAGAGEELCISTQSGPTMNTSVIVVPGQACEGRSVALFVGFLSQIWKFSSSHTGKQAQSQPSLDPGGIQEHLPFVSLFDGA